MDPSTLSFSNSSSLISQPAPRAAALALPQRRERANSPADMSSTRPDPARNRTGTSTAAPYAAAPRAASCFHRSATGDSLDSFPSYGRLDTDVETACNGWDEQRRSSFFSLPKPSLPWSAPKFDRKIRDPASANAISYSVRPKNIVLRFFLRFLGFLIFTYIVSKNRGKLGVCAQVRHTSVTMAPDSFGRARDHTRVPEQEDTTSGELIIFWAETLVGTGVTILIAQGYNGLRTAREHMERVRQTATTIAYAFIKTTNVNDRYGATQEELQLLIYECLALLTAYPVALVQQIQGNTCEPAITQYCSQVARALKKLRDGDADVEGVTYHPQRPWLSPSGMQLRYARVDYFFEIFCLRLQKEYREQRMRTKLPAMTVQHIVFDLRNHFENMVDGGNLDDRRMPIVRENIDMLALAGRECAIFNYTDCVPIACLTMVDIAMRITSVVAILQNCHRLFVEEVAPTSIASTVNWRPAVFVCLMSASILTILEELWRTWMPFHHGIDTVAWATSMAKEIDCMLNEFDEDDSTEPVRKHAYMRSSVYAFHGDGGGGAASQESQRPISGFARTV